jgi:putative pyruvate formate lyase activating enzyme
MPIEYRHIKTVASGFAAQLSHCTLCPRGCGVDRLAGERGYCRTGPGPEISGFEPHFGEEGCLTGSRGSGAVFFTGCNLECVFCQTFEISQLHQGTVISTEELSEIMLALQDEGCHNLNLVTPTHQIAAIVDALGRGAARGFDLPVVYNSSGYESVETLKALVGLVDIYLPDFKVWEEEAAERHLGAEDYPAVTREAIKEMHRQVGDLVLDENGLARRGILVRHLVLPEGLAGTAEILRFIHQEISPATWVNLMGHYHPCGRAEAFPPLDRPLRRAEFDAALTMAREIGLSRLDETHRPLLSLLLRA